MSQLLTGAVMPGLPLQAQLGLQQSLGCVSGKRASLGHKQGIIPVTSGGTAAGLSGSECGREG